MFIIEVPEISREKLQENSISCEIGQTLDNFRDLEVSFYLLYLHVSLLVLSIRSTCLAAVLTRLKGVVFFYE